MKSDKWRRCNYGKTTLSYFAVHDVFAGGGRSRGGGGWSAPGGFGLAIGDGGIGKYGVWNSELKKEKRKIKINGTREKEMNTRTNTHSDTQILHTKS